MPVPDNPYESPREVPGPPVADTKPPTERPHGVATASLLLALLGYVVFGGFVLLAKIGVLTNLIWLLLFMLLIGSYLTSLILGICVLAKDLPGKRPAILGMTFSGVAFFVMCLLLMTLFR